MDSISDMAIGYYAKRNFKALLLSSLGLLAIALLRPVDVHAETCTIDPLGGEVCLPDEDPDKPDKPNKPNKSNDPNKPNEPNKPNKPNDLNDPGDGNEDPPKDPKRVVIVPPCFGPCTQFPPALPYRQFAEEPAPEPEPEPTPEPMLEPAEEPAPAEPIRPLWMKSDALDDAVAEAYLERTLQHIAQGQSDGVVFDADADTVFIEVEGVRYREIINPHSLLFTTEVNKPAVNAWVRGFGGVNSNGAAGHRYADFDNGGAQLGVDIPLSDTTRIGLFGTYAVMNGRDGGRGSWDADGWGGGAYAEYWSKSLVLRGMISAGGYDGKHRRSINGETAKGNRSGNSWTGVVSVAAPLESGDWLIEPQAQISYTNTSLDKFSEHGADREDQLKYHAMEVDQLGSEISLKFARPIRDGERSLFLPSLRVGWAADWGMSGGDQKVTYRESGKSKHWDVNGGDDHAALIELGLDYTTYNFNGTSVGVYARGGALVWGGDRGTSWQVQGGLSFRF